MDIESTCQQYQLRFKPTGQFWSKAGDEALRCRETFCHKGRRHDLFSHVQPPAHAKKHIQPQPSVLLSAVKN